jgi:hypothetical protein
LTRHKHLNECYRGLSTVTGHRGTSPSYLLDTDTIFNCNSPLAFTECRSDLSIGG